MACIKENKPDIDPHRVDLIWNSVVGFIGYYEIFGGLTRGPEVVLDDDSEGARWKAVMTNLNEPAALRNSKKNLDEYNSLNDLPAEIGSDTNTSGRATTEITRSA
jgi:hypothetical protein